MSYRHVLLVGGPATIPSRLRIQTTTSSEEIFKLPWLSGYEHFIDTGENTEVNGVMIPAFRWSRSTRIAE